MTATVRLPRMLSETVQSDLTHDVVGATVEEALTDLFAKVPGLRHHIRDETGAIRPHVSVFVDGLQADNGTPLREGSEIRVLHAVSGGSPPG
ncbi:MAG: MoaD/ThiS family protein [Actinomycetota bacterium]